MDKDTAGSRTASPTRADLIAQGLLIDAPAQPAHDAGITVPVAFSAHAWSLYVGDDPDSQLPPILTALERALARAPHSESHVITGATTASGRQAGTRERLHAEVHPGDDGWPALLLMLPTDF
ncbi:hypothetical protein NW249_24030 [Streptomyces sp. OUCMDZ-4982]|uniref:hypothetical protein n=1 Tax=Streptomyces sp. OUCMDZ-4982 TaxID=2973090 RepID=UPI00215CADB7|nr:hypothetical protein [Streptomyces sp. OUCMDZ-4982]MCR8945190.1 hypothetical protein [Streptomyces sp. OUCMDZ-4982]